MKQGRSRRNGAAIVSKRYHRRSLQFRDLVIFEHSGGNDRQCRTGDCAECQQHRNDGHYGSVRKHYQQYSRAYGEEQFVDQERLAFLKPTDDAANASTVAPQLCGILSSRSSAKSPTYLEEPACAGSLPSI